MTIVNFTPGSALLGGLLIGLATALVLLVNGKIAGISGVVARLLRGVPGDTAWRGVFLAGMLAGGGVTFLLYPPSAAFASEASLPQLLIAGFLVGLGARVGGGCTSGHGVCGLGRGSRRSLVATLTFMGVAGLVVFVARHLVGGAP